MAMYSAKSLLLCMLIVMFLIEVALGKLVHPYIVFLNSSSVASSPTTSASIQNRSTTRAVNKLSKIKNSSNEYNNVSSPEIYSIGNFHWYVDSLNDADAHVLAQNEHVSQMHKDDPIFYMTELVQTDVPSWVRGFRLHNCTFHAWFAHYALWLGT